MPQRLTFPVGPALLLAVLAVVAILARPLTPIDETRYVSVAWEMWLRGDYLVLYKNGAPYSHKPPLLFWLYNLGWAVTGVNEWWPRLISPLFSLGSLLAALSIGRRLWPGDAEAGRHAAWILASCLLWMLFSTSAMFDVMLTLFVLLGLRGLLIAADGAMKRGFTWLAFSIGLGVLAKGPVILLHVLPVAMLAPWWRPGLAWKRWYGGILLAVLGGAAIALAWAIPAAIQGGDEYRRMIFWGQTADRMVDSFAHRRPFWWYVPLLPVMFFPWLLWPALWRRLAALGQEGLDFGLRFCLAWIVLVFVALSFISGKQVHYLVPLVPAFALLAGRLLANGLRSGFWLPALLFALAGLAMLAAALIGLPDKPGYWKDFPWWPGLLLLGLTTLTAWLGGKDARRLPALALLGAGLYGAILLFFSSNLWRSYDIAPIAREIARLQARGIPVANHGPYHAQYQFAGRLRGPLEEIGSAESIQGWFGKNPQGVAVFYFNYAHHRDGPALFSQPYRGEFAVLLDAAQARQAGFLR